MEVCRLKTQSHSNHGHPPDQQECSRKAELEVWRTAHLRPVSHTQSKPPAKPSILSRASPQTTSCCTELGASWLKDRTRRNGRAQQRTQNAQTGHLTQTHLKLWPRKRGPAKRMICLLPQRTRGLSANSASVQRRKICGRFWGSIDIAERHGWIVGSL